MRQWKNPGMRNIIFLGLVSFFADISSEMVYPLIPLYLTWAFGAKPMLIGIIEGIAESLASLLKVYSGYISDKYKRKKPIAFLGYSTGILYKFALIFATSWTGILGARVIDRFGKGIRTAPRDVMVSESADKNQMGQAFGIHKALDMAGSALGILLAFFIMKGMGENGYQSVFMISLIPIIIALGLFFFIKENPVSEGKEIIKQQEREHFWKNIGKLDGNLKLYLLVAFLFTLGNSSNTFLLLRAGNGGFSPSEVIFLYFIYNVSASFFAIPMGRLSDKLGRKQLLVTGYLIFSLVYFGFAFLTSRILIIGIFILYGIYTGMTAGVERAFISEIAPSELKGTMLGLHSTLVGMALLPASAIAGILWGKVGAFAPFLFGGCLALLSAGILFFGLETKEMDKTLG